MINRTTISRTLTALLIACGTAASAQDKPAGDDNSAAPESKARTASFAVSVNGGLTFSYTDVKPSGTAPVFGIGGAYRASSYLHVNLDLQKGQVKGGTLSASGSPTTEMGSRNNFFAAALTARFLPLGLVKSDNAALRFFSELYGGTGLGLISSSVDANNITMSEYGTLNDYSGASLMLPVEAGINLPVARLKGGKGLFVNLNYRVNLCFSDKIDGYVPTVTANKKNDAYNSLTAGVVLSF